MPRILLISNISPRPLSSGGNQRTHHLLEALRSIGDVDLLLIPRHDEPDESHLAELQREYGTVEMAIPRRRGSVRPWKWARAFAPRHVDRAAHVLGDRRFYYRPDPSASRQLAAMLSRQTYDAFVTRYVQSAGLSGIVGARPLLIDVDDLDTHVVEANLRDSGSDPLKRLIFGRQLRQLRDTLPDILGQASHCWVTTSEDGAAMPSDRFSVLPNIPSVSAARLHCEELPDSKRILLVGAMYFRPNAQGAAFFVEKVWPLVRAVEPTAEFRIVGGGLDAHLAERWSRIPGVDVAGFVDAIAAEYARAAFAIVPVVLGGGTKIKLPEALAYGRTCVVTTHAHRGYEDTLRHDQALLVADDAVSFARHCIDLLRDVDKRRTLATRGRAIVEDRFSPSRFTEIVRRDVLATIEASRGRTRG